MDDIVHTANVDILIVAHEADGLRLELDHATQHLAVLHGVDVPVPARDCNPVLHVVEPKHRNERRHCVQLYLCGDVRCRTVQDVDHPVLRAQHEHANSRRLVHVLLQDLHAGDGGLLLQQAVLVLQHKLRLLVWVLHGKEVYGVVGEDSAVIASHVELVVGSPEVYGLLLELLPDLNLCRVHIYWRQGELEVRTHVPVDEDLVPAGHGQCGYRRRGHLMVEALHGAGGIQQLLLPLDCCALVDPNALLEVHHDQPVVPLRMQIGQAHEGRVAAHARDGVGPGIQPRALPGWLGVEAV
mmetsp:Transcript_44114/g.140516  ORF Transcript_44114/g.140516 Transcript_44114/m.140516 type:complete len:297 (-) Transcript_44114:112-1002(-)